MLDKNYIIINLNKAESAETRQARLKERFRWGTFCILVAMLVGVNAMVWSISLGYDDIIRKKVTEISRLKDEIDKLQSEGKNLSKEDILSFADLEQERFLWAQNLEKMGSLTPNDIAITGLRYKRQKLVIKGIALTFEDRKDFEIIDEYVQTLRNNNEFSKNFSKIKYVGHSKVNVRGQEIVRFEIEASSKRGGKKKFS
jgi:Tfp pilus assembly protein PilN